MFKYQVIITNFITYKEGCMNSMAVGVQAPRIKRSNNLVKPAPLPFMVPIIIIIIQAFGYNFAACVTPSYTFLALTYHTAVPTSSWGVFFNGANMGSPSKAFATIAPENITSMVDNQHARGCLRENA
uniref:Uncharacterized protein n=1 Tax=Glossina brevipalpis TaxID=37001 RepID=A0A1A9WFD5_9MUSC